MERIKVVNNLSKANRDLVAEKFALSLRVMVPAIARRFKEKEEEYKYYSKSAAKVSHLKANNTLD